MLNSLGWCSPVGRLPKKKWREGEEPRGGNRGGGAQLGSPCAAGLVVDVVPSDDIGSPCGHGRANSEGETLVKSLSEQGQHLVALRAVREVGHPCGARVPNSWVGVFSLRGRGGTEQLAVSKAWIPIRGQSGLPSVHAFPTD